MKVLGQGATEYLVLLAVVLIVALVSVALLGFFPGMASDAQMAQSQMYWKSATPIAIVEIAARAHIPNGYTYPYLRIRNTGAYTVRLIGLIGSDGATMPQFGGDMCGAIPWGNYNITDYYLLGPGEEKYFAYNGAHPNQCNQLILSSTGGSSGNWIGGAATLCQNSSAAPGTLQYNSLGFEYYEYIENNAIRKKQVGTKPLIVKCLPPA
jgi:hypothetical protein